ncbi:hypothetical protein [Candidatus Endomicrobiellum cubanum]|jgi:hypothetical protein|uniref:hypothetical protein n=1 Tax=Candidatus Endomicrobiellum cubanum TaxID=3242325 RepID=UPI0035947BC2
MSQAKVPNGGLPGEFLGKLSVSDGDVAWIDPLDGIPANPYRGEFASLTALQTAYPTDSQGAYATITGQLFIYNNGWEVASNVYRGKYNILSDLITAYPTDVAGALALVADDLYIYHGEWIISSQGVTGIDHNKLENLQGGEFGYRGHLEESESIWVKEKMSGVPATPINYAPIDGALDIFQAPLFTLSPYSSPLYIPLLKINVMIATDDQMTDVVFWDDVFTNNVEFEIPAFWAIIQANTTYYWQARFVDEEGRQSSWSDITSFTTLATFEATIVKTPKIIYPSKDGLRIPSVNPSFVASEFAVIGVTDTHESSDWELANSPLFESAGIIADTTDDITNKVMWTPTVTVNGSAYVRTRQKGVLTTEKSPWSTRRMFLPREYYTGAVIGVGLRLLEDGNYYTHWIDEGGNDVNLASNYFDNHLCYKHPLIIIAGQHMATVVPTYAKCEKNESAQVGEDKYRWWVSYEEFDGCVLHPAFDQSDGPIYLSRYMGGALADNSANVSGSVSSVTNLCSLPNSAVWSSSINLGNYETFTTQSLINKVAWLNTDVDNDHKGWHVESIYDLSLINLLQLIEFRSFDYSTGDWFGSTTNQSTSTASFVPWRNIQNMTSNTRVCLGAYAGKSLDGNTSSYYVIGDPKNLATQLNVALVPIEDTWPTNKIVRIYCTDIYMGEVSTLNFDVGLLFLVKEATTYAIADVPFNPVGIYLFNVSRTNDMYQRKSINEIMNYKAISFYTHAGSNGNTGAIVSYIGKWTKS